MQHTLTHAHTPPSTPNNFVIVDINIKQKPKPLKSLVPRHQAHYVVGVENETLVSIMARHLQRNTIE